MLQKGEVTMPTTSTKRRFEFVAGTSDKFWETEVKGKEVLVRFGRNGTNGQSSTKTFADEAAAKKHAERLIAEKLAKGYIEVSS
jgi:predicted DNA-binding WGR domain protein